MATLEQHVHELLDNCEENGYFDDFITEGYTPKDIALDILAYCDDSTFYERVEADLTPHVESWIKIKGKIL